VLWKSLKKGGFYETAQKRLIMLSSPYSEAKCAYFSNRCAIIRALL
jgi:hypothetical protein